MANISVQTAPDSTQLIPFVPEGESDGGHDGEVVSVEEYLRTMYHPDCDYVDGHLEKRNVGEFDHGRIQKRLLYLFMFRETEWQVECIQEQWLQYPLSTTAFPTSWYFQEHFTPNK